MRRRRGRLGESRRPDPTSGFPADTLAATGHFDAPTNTTGPASLTEGLEAWMTVASLCRLHLGRARHLRGDRWGRCQGFVREDRAGGERVARRTVPGAGKPCSASTVWDLPGVNRTPHISLRMREMCMSIKGCEDKCQFRRYISQELRLSFRPHALIAAARQQQFSGRR
jgi:hypothetical protein